MEIKRTLIQYGLSEKEVDIYLFLLSNRDVPVYEIARQTRIPRTSVYNILEELEAQRIVSSWKKNGVKHYSPENPDRLNDILKQKQDILLKILPDIKNLYSHESVTPSTRVYIGKEGVKHVFNNILEKIRVYKHRNLYVFSDFNLTEQLPKFFSDWRKKKNATQAFTHLIVPPGTPRTPDYTSNEYRETRMMPDEFPFEGSIDICGSHIAFFSFKKGELYSITIDSEIIANMLTLWFKYTWKTLENRRFD